MVADRIENADIYFPLGTRIAKALRYIKETDFTSIQSGTYEIEGKDIYAVVSKYFTKDKDSAKLEVHKKYIDVQYVITGSELIGYAPLSAQDISSPYNEENDYTLYNGVPDFIKFDNNMFAIFFPSDLHMPGILHNRSIEVTKVVVKVKI